MNDAAIVSSWIDETPVYRTDMRLSDPETCGEDLVRNLDIVAQVAPSLCHECCGHHVRYAVSRLVVEKTPIDIDRREMVDYVRKHITTVGERQDTIDIVIAGAADTGILATCAHAAASLEAFAAKVRYTVIDICETPLVLCAEFGKRHELAVVTRKMDLTQIDMRYNADIIVLHSILRQIPPGFHLAMLRELSTWLKEDGIFLFSTRLHVPAPRQSKERQIEILVERQRRGELQLSVPLESISAALMLRKQWLHDFENTEEIELLFRRCDLLVKSEKYIEKSCDAEGLSPIESRYVAILARRGSAPRASCP